MWVNLELRASVCVLIAACQSNKKESNFPEDKTPKHAHTMRWEHSHHQLTLFFSFNSRRCHRDVH